MKGKKLIAIILMLVFSIPLAPIAQVGSLLNSNQLQEEVLHGSFGKEIHKNESELTLHPPIAQTLIPEPLSLNESLYSRQADDITTPPPNL